MPSVRNISNAAILAAGLGTRIQGLTHAKPLLKVAGQSLVAWQIARFLNAGVKRLIVAVRDELFSETDRAELPQDSRIEYLFVNTPSSLHTLAAVASHVGTDRPLLASMVDTVLPSADFSSFIAMVDGLAPEKSALLCTRFIDDESPLYAHLEANGNLTAVNSEPSATVTAGMYWLSPAVLKRVSPSVDDGIHKMRNFLNRQIQQGHPFSAHVVEKSIDLDRPEDLKQAEQFL